MTVYGIQFWIECKGGLKTANELSDTLDDLVYDGNLSLVYSNHSIMGAGLFMKNAVQNNFKSIREILNEFADKIKYVSEWDYEDSSDMRWGVHTLGESKKSVRNSIKVGDVVKNKNRDDLFGLVYKVEGERITMYVIDKDTHTYNTRDAFTGNSIDYEKVNFKVAPMEESKKSARKSIKEAFGDAITVKEFCFWGYSGNTVEIWTTDGVLCDSFEVRNVGKSEYKNYEIHGWDCAKNTVIIYIKK